MWIIKILDAILAWTGFRKGVPNVTFRQNQYKMEKQIDVKERVLKKLEILIGEQCEKMTFQEA